MHHEIATLEGSIIYLCNNMMLCYEGRKMNVLSVKDTGQNLNRILLLTTTIKPVKYVVCYVVDATTL